MLEDSGWHWAAWDTAAGTTSTIPFALPLHETTVCPLAEWDRLLPLVDTANNLKGTLPGTDTVGASADLAGCCTNPNASAGNYDATPHYVLQQGLLSRGGATAIDDSSGTLYDVWLTEPDAESCCAWLVGATRSFHECCLPMPGTVEHSTWVCSWVKVHLATYGVPVLV